MVTPRLCRLRRVAFWAIVLLLGRVLTGMLSEYPRYFPADFETDFLSGRRWTFDGWYAIAFYFHILVSPLALVGMVTARLLAHRDQPRLWRLHKFVGRTTGLMVIFVLAPTGLLMATRAYAGVPAQVALSLLGIATGTSMVFAVRHAIAGQIATHQRWADRCLILLLSPLILRVLNGAGSVLEIYEPRFYQTTAWASWLVPLLIWELRMRSIRRPIFDPATAAVSIDCPANSVKGRLVMNR